MSDFFREVDEDYRRERLIQIWTKHRTLFIGVAVLLVAATAAWRIYQHFHLRAAEAAGARYETALRASNEGKSSDAEADFKAIAAAGPRGYAMLARFRAIDEVAAADPEGALSAYDALAADGGLDRTFRDLAQARAASLRVDRDDPKQFEARYGALAASDFTYHDTIRELLALAALHRDDYEAAGRWLDMIISDARSPGPLRQRAEAFLALVQAGKIAVATPAPAPGLLDSLGAAGAPTAASTPDGAAPASSTPAATPSADPSAEARPAEAQPSDPSAETKPAEAAAGNQPAPPN